MVIDALDACVCGPTGQKREWDKMGSRFIPGARIISAGLPENGCTHRTPRGIKEFIGPIEGVTLPKGF
jgi:hypothetical protein